jgi:ribosomal protein S18 acetylase RimI-like enzyme
MAAARGLFAVQRGSTIHSDPRTLVLAGTEAPGDFAKRGFPRMSVSTPVQGSSPPPVDQTFWWRRLDPATDKELLKDVQIGGRPWEQEVEIHIREKALPHEKKGNCRSALFFLQDQKPIVGLLSVSTEKLVVTDELREMWEISNRNLPFSPVDAAFIAAYGVDARFRGNGEGYGKQMHAMLIDSLVESVLSPRFISLKVWEDSPAVKFYRDLRYRVLGDPVPEDRFGEQVGRLKMVLDRFWVPKSG